MDLPIWNAALKDASLSETSVRLILVDGEPPHVGQGGFFQPAGQYLLPAAAGDLAPHVDRINEHPDIDRVGFWLLYPEVMTAGLIRHELEHVCQHQRFGMVCSSSTMPSSGACSNSQLRESAALTCSSMRRRSNSTRTPLLLGHRARVRARRS
jgi:hypothetical protein